eukprot:TRINITY_DN20138_c0_g1_i1.p1 TRINITY_DN20138_c0_g1~~TRINITY_DN20138_c0_g1_i1.p1  ORF type:complete len:325 (-),score=63.47 TRINITY_DN20138_c0_g1_i1:139-1113(-)
MSQVPEPLSIDLFTQFTNSLTGRVRELRALTVLRVNDDLKPLVELNRAVCEAEREANVLQQRINEENALVERAEELLHLLQCQATYARQLQSAVPAHVPGRRAAAQRQPSASVLLPHLGSPTSHPQTESLGSPLKEPPEYLSQASLAAPAGLFSETGPRTASASAALPQQARSLSAKASGRQTMHVPQRRLSARPLRGLQEAPPMLRYVTSEELAKVAYVGSRLTVQKANAAIEELNELVAAKYKLLAIPYAKLTPRQLQQVKVYRELETPETKAVCFFVDGDLRTAKHCKMDASGKALLTVLRQLGRLREVRGGGIVRYVVLP